MRGNAISHDVKTMIEGLPSPHDIMLANFVAARSDYVAAHKSKHWDIFVRDYERVITDVAAWKDFRRNGISDGLDTAAYRFDLPAEREITNPKEVRRVQKRYESLSRLTGARFIREYCETDIGNPAYVMLDGIEINTIDLRHIYNAWRLGSLWQDERLASGDGRPIVVEIGGGYGGLAVKLKRLFPDALVILFDLPEVNAIQTYYVTKALPSARLAYYTDLKGRGAAEMLADRYDLLILPGWEISALPDGCVDLCINIRSMMEMNREVGDSYMAAINRLVRPGGLFYCVNRYVKSTVGEPIRIKDYGFDDHWYFTLSAPAWDQPWVHELAAVRTSRPNAFPARQVLSGVPPVTWKDVLGHSSKAARAFKALTWGGHPNVNPGLRGGVINARKTLLRAASHWLRKYPRLRGALRRLRGRA